MKHQSHRVHKIISVSKILADKADLLELCIWRLKGIFSLLSQKYKLLRGKNLESILERWSFRSHHTKVKEEQIFHIIEEQPPQLTTIKGSQIVTNGDRRKVHGVCVRDLMNLAECSRRPPCCLLFIRLKQIPYYKSQCISGKAEKRKQKQPQIMCLCFY